MSADLLSRYSRMFPDCCLRARGGTLREFSRKWTKSGIMEHGECLTLNGSEWPSAAEGSSACSLASVLETGPVDERYYLSRKASRGILRRAEKRGKALPPVLEMALRESAGEPPASPDGAPMF